ncbi:MAG: HU family DNA-binding protein [Bdellovibrionales bacterium]|nr:HU family DNA-binding protein [Bdellovibrionales bacterium]
MARKPAKKKKTASRKTASKKSSSSKRSTRSSSSKKTAKKSSASKKASSGKTAAAKPVVQKVQKASKPKNGRTLAYTQSEFIENVRSYCGLSKRTEARDLCDDIASFITDSLKKGYRIPLMGLGKLYVRKSKARMGRNPATGEPIHIAAKKRVRFSVAKALKDSVL